jgi:pyridinium-3,5-biscarboxylic acid mononucleotide synthase
MDELKQLLQKYKNGELTENQVQDSIEKLSIEDLDFAKIDHSRKNRQGFPEVIFCSGKTDQQIIEIAKKIVKRNGQLLATRADKKVFNKLKKEIPNVKYNELAKLIYLPNKKLNKVYDNQLLIITAGTSDISVAEEARISAEVMGFKAQKIYDVGVSGIHRLFKYNKEIESAKVIIVAAGMEGALPSVVGGLVSVPVIAVPTSVGYGTSFNGLTALLSMLNSCANGITVVNIDNGYGAAFAACRILRSMSI